MHGSEMRQLSLTPSSPPPQTIKQFRQTTATDQIAILETQKVHLLQQKAQLERKLDVFKERVREREAEKNAKGK